DAGLGPGEASRDRRRGGEQAAAPAVPPAVGPPRSLTAFDGGCPTRRAGGQGPAPAPRTAAHAAGETVMRKVHLPTATALGLLLGGMPLFAAAPVDYVREVKPLLTARCYACHGGLQQKGDLRLD